MKKAQDFDIQKDIDGLFQSIHNTIEGEVKEPNDLLHTCLTFFTKVKESLEQGSKEENEKTIEALQGMQQEFSDLMGYISKQTGLTEEQIQAFAENAKNFSEEQSAVIDQIREEFSASQKQIEGEEGHKEKKGKGTKSRDKWIRS